MEIRRLGAIGAEITGVDVKAMDEATFGKTYQAWLDYNVIAVRDQELEIEDYPPEEDRIHWRVSIKSA